MCLPAIGAFCLYSCSWDENFNATLKFKPPLDSVYHFSLTKYSTKSWTYQQIPLKIQDTVYLNFSLQNIHKTDSLDTVKFTLYDFVWKGKSKVNYHRDSMYALSTNISFSDSGKVESLQDLNLMVKDIENDQATGKYLRGVIADQVSISAITDMFTRIFSVIPAKKVKPQDSWITNITLTTNHPVHFSNFLTLENINDDTATIEIQSNIFARRSPGDEFYIKGNQHGKALVNYETGIPYWYKTENEIVTTTNYYDIKELENFILIQIKK